MTMRSALSFVFLVLLINAATFFVPMEAVEPSPRTRNTIEHICRSMEDYGFCYKTFHNILPEPDADNKTLTRITIIEAGKNVTNTLAFINSHIPTEKDPNQHMHYVVCQNAYQILQSSFKSALDDYRGMAQYERDTPRVQASCTTIFSIPPFTENPLNERNREMRILLTMAIVTSSYIVT
ncbi:uncharacterized protein LOC141655645 [Silene latifolia]|uniref:uncharacterized protein LOC141655645 n=1 Tax=Silene latifolia TaxID=37657 RepID=UPI003D775FC5